MSYRPQEYWERTLSEQFDLRGTGAAVKLEKTVITLVATADFQLKQVREIVENKLIKRGISIKVAAAIDDSVALAVLQRDPPLPAGIVRNRTGMGHRRSNAGGLHGDGRIERQVMGPVVEPGVQRAFDQQRAKARAIDEQVGLDPPITVKQKRGNIAALPVEFDLGDPPLDPPRPIGFGTLAQECRIEAGIELIGIIHPFIGQMGKLARQRGLQFQAVFIVALAVPGVKPAQPEVLEPDRSDSST